MHMKGTKLRKGSLLLLSVCVLLLLAACASDPSGVTVDGKNSYFRDFTVEYQTVTFSCHYTLVNNTGKAQTVQIRGDFTEDRKLGLVTESVLLAQSSDGSTYFPLPAGKTELDVAFVGTYGGTHMKENRLLPAAEIQITAGE